MFAMLMGWMLVGLAAATLGQLRPGARSATGFVPPMLVGIAGALLGGYLGQAFGEYGMANALYWLTALAGSAVLLIAYRTITKSRN